MKLVVLSILNLVASLLAIFFIVMIFSSFEEVRNSSVLKIILGCSFTLLISIHLLQDKLNDILIKLEKLEKK